MRTPTAMVAPHCFEPSDLAPLKATLRAEALRRRAACDPALAGRIIRHVLAELDFPRGSVIAGVWPFRDEPDLRPLWQALHDRGHRVVLPETTGRGQVLRFRRWAPDCEMIRERFGTMRPGGELAAPEILFVPLLAFDRRGFRLGYGGGFYDRTLAALPGAISIGFGYAALEVERVPTAAHDQPVRMIVTEDGVYVPRIDGGSGGDGSSPPALPWIA